MSELSIYRSQNFGNSIGFGRKAALVLVDFTVGFNDATMFGGGNIDAAVKRSVGLLKFFREARLPIAFTRIVYAEGGADKGVFLEKIPSLAILTEAHPAGQIVPELAPKAGEYLVRKTQASAFFGTALAPWLVQQGADTVVVTGCTTSGCVRATVVDACAYNFRPMVVTDCVGDRAIGPHEANLFDMGQKYGDLVPRDEVIRTLSERRAAA